MANFLRECVAREGQEHALRGELIAVYERVAVTIPHLAEALLYREHFSSRRFLSIARYDDDRAIASAEHSATLDALTAAERAYCETPSQSRPVDVLYEHATARQRVRYSVVALLTALSEGMASEVGRRMSTGATAFVERFDPMRLIVARVVDGLRLLVMVDASETIDIDRYLASSLRRRHMDALAPYLAAPPEWYALDPVWRYFRGV